MLRPSQLLVDREHHVQRPVIARHVKNLASDFSPALFGQGSASLRADGRYYILDSQHRCEAAKIAGYGDHEFPFRIWRGLSIAQEATLYLALNAKKVRDNAINAFLVGVQAGYPTNTEVVRILQSYKLTVGSSSVDGQISAADALVRIYEGRIRGASRGGSRAASTPLPRGHLLSRSLTILTHAWGTSRDAFDSLLLNSVAMLLAKHDTAVDGIRLAKLLSRIGPPRRIIGEIRTLKDAGRMSAAVAGVQYLENVYNKKLTDEKRLK